MVGIFFLSGPSSSCSRFPDGVKYVGDMFLSHEAQRSSEVHLGPPSTCTFALTRDQSESTPPPRAQALISA